MLETLGNADPLKGVDAVRPGHLAAEARCRDHLAGVADPGGIERPPQSLERVQISLREHPWHRAGLVHSDPVLARERSTRVEAGIEDGLGKLAGGIGLTGRG